MVMGTVITKNFKLIASIILYAVLDYMDEITNSQPDIVGEVPEMAALILTRIDIAPVFALPYMKPS